jgi:aspartyl/asparaginyl beta-hydroxylase (cupin superfamily)
MNEIFTYIDENIISIYKEKLLYLKNNFKVIQDECLEIPIEKYENLTFMKDIVDNDYKWKVYLIRYKWKTIDFCDYAPKTAKILQEIDCVNGGFSLFLPNTETELHAGTTPYTYRSHLGLDVPENCGFECLDKNLSIKNGEINFFDATDIHKAWNKSNKNRLILLIDFIKNNVDKQNILRGDKQKNNAKIYK